MEDRLEDHDEVIEIIVDFKKGFYSKQNAIRQLVKRGFEPGIAEVMLMSMKKDNVVDIRGYSKQPPHLLKGAETLRRQSACRKAAVKVETDNK